jgi:hypothetical protein
MATRQEVIDDIRCHYGNMLNVTQLAKLFNCDRRTVPTYVEGIPFFTMGKDKKYLALDVGRRIYDRMEGGV